MMRASLVVVLALAWPRAAAAEIPPACDREGPRASRDPIPAWSRLQWSVAIGWAGVRSGGDFADGRWESSTVVVPQLGYAVWARETFCVAYGEGGGFFLPPRVWRRWSLAASVDAAWRPDEGDLRDFRPSLRASRARMARGELLSIGSTWVPSNEQWISIGPTFTESRWTGASLGLGVRFSIFTLEARGALHPDGGGQELMFLVGVADLHGLFRLGPDRSDD